MKNLLIVFAFIVFACTESNQRLAPEIKIGNEYQGGIVFYLFQPGDADYIEGETHGLIGKDSTFTSIWGCQNAPKLEFIEDIGYGDHNTNVIINKCSNNAATKCKSIGWFLPNRAEFEELLKVKHLFTLNSSYYWTSSKSTYTEAFSLKFDGNVDQKSISETHNVIPIKKF